MTDAKFSDIDKQVYPRDECFTIQVKNLKEKIFLEFDIHSSQREEKIKDAMALAFKNGAKWMQWKQIDGKLTKVQAGMNVPESEQRQVA